MFKYPLNNIDIKHYIIHEREKGNLRWALGKAQVRNRQGTKKREWHPGKEMVSTGEGGRNVLLVWCTKESVSEEMAVLGLTRASLRVCSMCSRKFWAVQAEDLGLGNLRCLLIQNNLSRKVWGILPLWHRSLCSGIPLWVHAHQKDVDIYFQ